MNGSSWMKGPPEAVLLSTDMSVRCDRALDRAASLAAQWGAKLVVLHVLEEAAPDLTAAAGIIPSWHRPTDPAAEVMRELVADVGPLAANAAIVIEHGDTVAAILRTVEEKASGLIVTGVARDEPLGRLLLGRTVDGLLRRAPTPLLVVRSRVRGPYRNVVVATDFSESSRHALQAAARFFPDQRLTVFHAYDAPMSGLVQNPAQHRNAFRDIAARDCEAFLQGVDWPPGSREPPQTVIEHGAPDHLLRDYVRARDVDLVVLGTHGRSAVFDILIGSVARRVMDGLPCDALIVRGPRAASRTGG